MYKSRTNSRKSLDKACARRLFRKELHGICEKCSRLESCENQRHTKAPFLFDSIFCP